MTASGLAHLEQVAEDAYSAMYDASDRSTAAARYSDAKDAFRMAIEVAQELGMIEDAKRLAERLDHVKAVFRSQFS